MSIERDGGAVMSGEGRGPGRAARRPLETDEVARRAIHQTFRVRFFPRVGSYPIGQSKGGGCVKDARRLVQKAADPCSPLGERHEAFGELVTGFQDMAFGGAYAVLGDFYLAEDAAQEAFIAAWQRLDQLRAPEAFPGWLRRIVLTRCNRLTRGRRLR